MGKIKNQENKTQSLATLSSTQTQTH